MAKKKGLYEEALLEANAIKSIALKNAKNSIYESYDSYLKEKISEKLDTMNEEDSMDEEVDLNELLSEIDEEDEFPTEEAPSTEPDGDEMSGMTDEDADKAIGEMTSEELIALIRDAVSQEMNGGAEEGESMEGEEGQGLDDGSGFGDDEEVDLDELLNEVDEQLATPVQTAPVQNTATANLQAQNAQLRTQLAEAKRAINVYKNALNESKLFASKSNALTKVFSKSNLSESQKMKIAEKFDQAKTEREVQLIYSTLKESIGKIQAPKQKPLASKVMGSTKTLNETTKNIIGNEMKSRFQELAGITKGTKF